MKNILYIIRRDRDNLFSNVVAMVILMGLVVIPSLYAWFNINSNWDPYGEDATGNLVIAVYSSDRGADIFGMELNVGEKVVEALKGNHVIGWVFPEDERTALNGVYSGEYYAALVIPETFTNDILSVTDGNFQGGRMYYYENEKKNAIATKITGKAKNAVENQINSTVMSTITELIAKAGRASDISDNSIMFDSVTRRIESVRAKAEGYIDVVNVLIRTTRSADSLMEGSTVLNEKIISDLRGDLSLVGGLGADTGLSALSLANMRMADYLYIIREAGDDLGDLKKALKGIISYLDELEDNIDEVKDSDKLKKLMEVLENEPEQIAVFFSTPLDLETQAIYPVKNYGSQMAPFYTVLAIWFGSLILVAIIHTAVKPVEGVKKLHIYEEFFGRYFLFFVTGQIQTIVCVLGDLFFCEIQSEHKFLFWLVCATSSFAFTILIFSLTFAFGNVGEALAVIVMVIQVAGAGGTFPKEVLPGVYRMVYSFMPFTYAMDGIKETVGGLYGNVFLECELKLLAVAGISIVIGFVGRIIFSPMNHLMEEAKEKTGLML